MFNDRPLHVLVVGISGGHVVHLLLTKVVNCIRQLSTFVSLFNILVCRRPGIAFNGAANEFGQHGVHFFVLNEHNFLNRLWHDLTYGFR
ncbi:hypothetical protein D3C72_1344090 [compost metagenome]